MLVRPAPCNLATSPTAVVYTVPLFEMLNATKIAVEVNSVACLFGGAARTPARSAPLARLGPGPWVAAPTANATTGHGCSK